MIATGNGARPSWLRGPVRGNQWRLGVLLAVGLGVLVTPGHGVQNAPHPGPSHGPAFRVRSYLGKCLTYGQVVVDPIPEDPPPPVILASGAASPSPRTPVYLAECDTLGLPGAIEPVLQHVVVEEINERHEVLLRAGDKYVGVAGDFLVERAPLELQDFLGGPGQVFALDGDSIILVADRALVVEVRNAKGTTGTPLVLGERNLDDSEFWDFHAVDATYQAPTKGFVRFPQDARRFRGALAAAHWGTVIQVDPDAVVDLKQFDTLAIPGGVTLRGGRRGLVWGALLTARGETEAGSEFVIDGPHTRITGFRLRGPTRSKSEGEVHWGIVANTHYVTLVDHNEMFDWPGAPVRVNGPNETWACAATRRDATCSLPAATLPFENVHVVRNFIHHNVRDGRGYGVAVYLNAFAEVLGNTFLMNRHAIEADGTTRSGYSARFNLVLSNVPSYGISRHEEHDFDMHASDGSSHHTGGIAGGNVEISRNTFLGSNRLNFDLRGVSCGLARFVDNVSQQDEEDAIRWYVPVQPSNPALAFYCNAELTTMCARLEHHFECGRQATPGDTPPSWLEITGNRFGAANPAARLGVGDFDGDGSDDLFLATGAAWYFSPAGLAEWRYLKAETSRIDEMRFGDFDRDRRTDVLARQGDALVVSWGGLSRWEKINESPHPLADCAIGDFDGDGRADVLCADGREWLVSYGGVGPFVYYALSGKRVGSLRFGDFDGDKKTDVLGVVSRDWQVVYGGTETWAPLRPALTSTVAGLTVADFDGDGLADIASSIWTGLWWHWRMSSGGTSDWIPLHSGIASLERAAGVGRFDDRPGADAMTWGQGSNPRVFDIVSSARGPARRWSGQEMR